MPLTVENGVFESGTNEDSERPHRKPYTSVSSTAYNDTPECCSKCRSTVRESTPECCSKCQSTASTLLSRASRVHWMASGPDGSERSSCYYFSTSLPDECTKCKRETQLESTCEALQELQQLESFLGLKNSTIGGGSSLPECCTCCYLKDPSGVSTATRFTTQDLPSVCPDCRTSSTCGRKTETKSCYSTSNDDDSTPALVRSSFIAASWSSPTTGCLDDLVRFNGCSSCSCSMETIPTLHDPRANDILLQSPGINEYFTAPAASTMTMTNSMPREDSRSGGRERRPQLWDICGECEIHNISNNTTQTALPIYDPNCQRCSEARFADRLCEKLCTECYCTPVIRTSPCGSISLIDNNQFEPTNVIEDRDTVMDKKNKKSLLNYLEKSKNKGRTLRENVMRWVRYKSEQCRSRMRRSSQKHEQQQQ